MSTQREQQFIGPLDSLHITGHHGCASMDWQASRLMNIELSFRVTDNSPRLQFLLDNVGQLVPPWHRILSLPSSPSSRAPFLTPGLCISSPLPPFTCFRQEPCTCFCFSPPRSRRHQPFLQHIQSPPPPPMPTQAQGPSGHDSCGVSAQCADRCNPI